MHGSTKAWSFKSIEQLLLQNYGFVYYEISPGNG